MGARTWARFTLLGLTWGMGDVPNLGYAKLIALLLCRAGHEPAIYQGVAGCPASVWQPARREVFVLYPAADGVAASPE